MNLCNISAWPEMITKTFLAGFVEKAVFLRTGLVHSQDRIQSPKGAAVAILPPWTVVLLHSSYRPFHSIRLPKWLPLSIWQTPVTSHLLVSARERRRRLEEFLPRPSLSLYQALFHFLASHSPCPHTLSRDTAPTLCWSMETQGKPGFSLKLDSGWYFMTSPAYVNWKSQTIEAKSKLAEKQCWESTKPLEWVWAPTVWHGDVLCPCPAGSHKVRMWVS